MCVSVICVCDFAGRFYTYLSELMLLPPEDYFLHKQHYENGEPLVCNFSYKKLFICIQEHLLKPLNVMTTSNVILFILSDKLNF